ncbi:MAG TPA: PAS domain S-box protein, partial [Dehalococcoidales bacterium]|nr:PAS domain S-box protein [Dehalococcoidales bacterium]
MKVLPDETSYIFENVFTHLPEPVIVMDKEFRILQANNAFISRCNKPASDIRYQSFLKMIQPELDNDNQLRKNLYTELIENQSSQFEAYVQTGPDQGFWSVIDCRLIKHNGRIFFLSVLKELTDHKEAYLSNLDIEKNKGDFENTDNLIQSIAPDGTLLSNNKKWQETLGYTSEELRRLNLTDILREDQIPRCFKLINRVRSGEKCDLIETVFKTRDGRDVFVEGNVDGYFEHGKLLSIRCVFRDKTKSKSLEETYSQLVHNFPVPIYIKRNNQFLFVNPSFEAMTGYGEQELVDRDGLFLVHPEDIPFVQKTAGRLPRTNKSASYEFRLIRKNGESRWVMETIVSISYEG